MPEPNEDMPSQQELEVQEIISEMVTHTAELEARGCDTFEVKYTIDGEEYILKFAKAKEVMILDIKT